MELREFEKEWKKEKAQRLRHKILLANSTLIYADKYKVDVTNGQRVIIFYNKGDIVAESFLEEIEGFI